ncbi:hypothetical protein JD844_015825 [Phrynosoma platyrhinos]|uniref:Eukaryotic translation initiation factor 3 subunit E n=1 Tax=Phrynosoma platyrhinos TaxID=52577 RepID=A0ABQ7SJJ9_PHRPL|nr:hypothetical protein JD844_015825 [Phrynosoma platyrhinos]
MKIYNEKELLQGKLDLLSDTKMVDFAMDIYKNLYSDDIPHALREKRTTVVAQLEQLKAETDPIVKMFEDPETTRQMQSTRDGRMLFDYLADKHGQPAQYGGGNGKENEVALEKRVAERGNSMLTYFWLCSVEHQYMQEYLDTLYRYAKIQYECGNYPGAAEYLYLFRVLVPSTDRNALSSLWGKLASEILVQNWDAAMEDLTRLKETIDNNSVSSPLQSLQQRTWLIHWSLFVFFNHPKGRDNIIDLFLYQPQYLNAIQTMCPHILRYLTTAVITNKDVRKRRQVLKDLVKVIQQESYTYKDPITEFVECLYVNFDFDGAQKKLRECESGHVVMGNNAVSPYQQVIEKTKSLSFRSQMLAMNIEKKLNQGSRAETKMIQTSVYLTSDTNFFKLDVYLRAEEAANLYVMSPFMKVKTAGEDIPNNVK